MHNVIPSIKRDTITKISSTALSEYPFLRSLCDMWSVPPVIGDLPDRNLEITTVVKSNNGIVKNKITKTLKIDLLKILLKIFKIKPFNFYHFFKIVR